MSDSNFRKLQKAFEMAARTNGTADDVSVVRKVTSKIAEYLSENHVYGGVSAALENFTSETVPTLNRFSVESEHEGIAGLMQMVTDCGVPERKRVSVAMDLARILGQQVDRASIYANESFNGAQNHVPLSDVVGNGAMGMLAAHEQGALEAYGIEIDKLQQDNRLSIVLTVLRSMNSIIDRILPRVSEESNVVSLMIPAPEVYDLAASQNASSAVRYGAANRLPLVTLYKQPNSVSTQLKPIVPLVANDTGAVATVDPNHAGAIFTDKRVNLFDLAADSTKVGYNNFDFSDLVAEGGRVATIYLRATHTSGGTVTTEDFALPVRYLPSAPYVMVPNNEDSGDRSASVKYSTTVRSGTLNAAGVASTMFAAYTDGLFQLDVNITSEINLKTSNFFASGAVIATLKPKTGTTAVGSATATDAALVTWSVLSVAPELYYDEENMRKTTLAVRMNYLERQFNIPMGRNILVDYSLTQKDDPNVPGLVNSVTSLGNTARGLGVIQSRLSDVSAALAFAAANPELASLVSPTKISFAGTLVLPYVGRSTIDYSDMKTAVMRESERLSDVHARFREALLNGLATLCAQSLYLNSLEPGETPVFKVLAYSTVADTIIGIKDYHHELDDETKVATGADYSMLLPNGYRIDVVKTNFVDFTNLLMILPVREADPTHITSFGSIRDRGQYVATYTPISNGGVQRRVVTNSREIVMPTNPCGLLFQITGLNAFINSNVAPG